MRWFAFLLTLALATPALAARPSYPELTDKELERLTDGKLVLRKSIEGEQSGTIVGVQRIDATLAEVWAVLLDFERVPESNDSIVVAEDYTAEMGRTPPAGSRFIDIHYELRVVGQSVQYNIHHTYRPSAGYLDWVLDDAKDNEIEASEGSFSVWPVAGSPGQVDFLYITRVDTGRNVPDWVEGLLTKTSLKGYIQFVKRVAEGG